MRDFQGGAIFTGQYGTAKKYMGIIISWDQIAKKTYTTIRTTWH